MVRFGNSGSIVPTPRHRQQPLLNFAHRRRPGGRHSSGHPTMKRCAILCLAALLLAACGQSGGLYLPGKQPPKQQSFFEKKKDQNKDGNGDQNAAPAAQSPEQPAPANPQQTPAPEPSTQTQPQPQP
jgi:predicted small lipoprotein YifL